ncbi:hypothetical protein [Pantoea ananatis]|uniref:hypothetical protein n=1 Tax=Pantoea ananas TaxID=553 RepID=UPI001575E8E3|nr:hypothetical protein [Pantoea ananatis]NQE77087.1 hypothetical protein [Pantoea ananatis]NQE85434.1 hypothetical protein [Pantoea ananatis]
MTLNADFGLVKNSIDAFLASKNIKEKLAHILEKGTNDWEKWIQIELEYFLEKELGYMAKREHRAINDRRSTPERESMFVDLIFRKRMTRKDRFIYLELKCSKRATDLLSGMSKDVTKVDSIKQSYYMNTSYKRRSFWCVGFYQYFSDLTINRAGEKLLKEHAPYYHTTIHACKCRGIKHKDECKKLGLIII